MPEKAALDDESMASEEEVGLIAQIREALAPELTQLQADGCDFPHITGDMFFLRVVRGNDRDVTKAVDWYKKFLVVRKEHDLDTIYKNSVDKGIPWSAEALPNAAEIRKHYNVHFDEAGLVSPGGYLIWYDSCGDINHKPLLEMVDAFKEFVRYTAELRMVALDRISKDKGRLVKLIRIMDCAGYSPWSANRQLTRLFRGYVLPLFSQTSIEVVHRVYLINTAWFAFKTFTVLKPVLPERVQERTRVLDANYVQAEELLKLVPMDTLAKLTETRFDSDSGSLAGTNRLIPAGRNMDKSMVVQADQKVSWSFRMGAPSEAEDAKEVRGLAGRLLDKGLGEASDVQFSVSLWSADGESKDLDEDCMMQEQVLVAASKVGAKDSTTTGSVVAPAGGGTIVLRWSNYTSWVRAKLVAEYEITLE